MRLFIVFVLVFCLLLPASQSFSQETAPALGYFPQFKLALIKSRFKLQANHCEAVYTFDKLDFEMKHIKIDKNNELEQLKLALSFEGALTENMQLIQGYSEAQHIEGFIEHQCKVIAILDFLNESAPLAIPTQWNDIATLLIKQLPKW